MTKAKFTERITKDLLIAANTHIGPVNLNIYENANGENICINKKDGTLVAQVNIDGYYNNFAIMGGYEKTFDRILQDILNRITENTVCSA